MPGQFFQIMADVTFLILMRLLFGRKQPKKEPSTISVSDKILEKINIRFHSLIWNRLPIGADIAMRSREPPRRSLLRRDRLEFRLLHLFTEGSASCPSVLQPRLGARLEWRSRSTSCGGSCGERRGPRCGVPNATRWLPCRGISAPLLRSGPRTAAGCCRALNGATRSPRRAR